MQLERLGYSVLATGDPEQGIEIAVGESPDLIVLDLFMPGMDGYEVARILQVKEETRHIPFIIVSSATTEQFRRRSKDWGAEAHLAKSDLVPPDPEPAAEIGKGSLNGRILRQTLESVLAR